MKYLITLFIATIFSIHHVTAQTYCGLTYYYDAGGNRVQRIQTSDCSPYSEGGGGGGDSRMLVTDSTISGLTEAVYPNPTSGPVSVVFNAPVTEAQITITDNLGRQLYNITTSGSSIPLDISRFAQGIYFIVVRTGGNSYESTVVKE